MAREAKAKEASCCDDRIIVTGAVIRHSTCKESKIDQCREGWGGGSEEEGKNKSKRRRRQREEGWGGVSRLENHIHKSIRHLFIIRARAPM